MQRLINVASLRLLFKAVKDENGVVQLSSVLGRRAKAYSVADARVNEINQWFNYKDQRNITEQAELYNQMTDSQKALLGATRPSTEALAKFREETARNLIASGNFSTKLKEMGTGLLNIGKSALSMAGNMLVWTLVAKGIELAYKAIDQYVNRVKYAQEAIDGIVQKWEEAAQKQKEAQKVVDDYGEEYAKLSQGVDTRTNANLNLSSAEYERYLEIVDAIGATSLGLVKSYDAQGHAILNLTDTVNGLNDALARMADENRGEILGNSAEIMNKLQTTVFDRRGVAERTKLLQDFAKQFEGAQSSLDALYDYLFDEYGINRPIYNELGVALSGLGIDHEKIYNEALKQDEITGEFVFDKSEYYKGFLDQYATISNAITENEAQIAALIAPARNLVSTIISDAFADNSEAFKGIAPSVQETLRQAAGELDYTFFEDKTGDEIQKQVQAMFTTPFLNIDNQEAITELDKAAQDFQKGVISHSDLMNIGKSTFDTLEEYGVGREVLAAIAASLGVDGKSIYSETIDAAKKAVSGDTAWIDNLNIKQLQHLRTLEDIKDLTESGFAESYNKALEAESLAFDTLTSSYTSYMEARQKAAEIAKAVDEQGYITPEQYKELGKEYRGAIRQDTLTGGYYIDYDELRRINEESERKQVEDAIKGREEAQKKHTEALREYSELLKDKLALDDETVVKQANVVNGLADQIDGYNLLINALENSTSAFQVWRNAMQQGEIGDEFRATKDAIDAINAGLKSGRVNTNAFTSSAHLIFGEDWRQMYKEGTLQKAIDQYAKFFDKDGEMDVAKFTEYAHDKGVLQRRKDGKRKTRAARYRRAGG